MLMRIIGLLGKLTKMSEPRDRWDPKGNLKL